MMSTQINITVFHSSYFTKSMGYNIDLSHVSIIITHFLSFLSSFPSLSFSSFRLNQFVFSLLLLKPFGSCHAGLNLLSRFLTPAFSTAVCLSAVDIGSCSCTHSGSLLFSSFATDDSEGL